MKFSFNFLIPIFIFLPLKNFGQLRNLSDYKTKKYDSKYVVFKIDEKNYKTDFRTIFLSENTEIYKNDSEKLIHFMIYNNSYLFIGHFPNTKEQILSSIGYEIRSVDELIIINLENKTEKWHYNLNNNTSLSNIIKFNPKNGELTYSNPVKILPN